MHLENTHTPFGLCNVHPDTTPSEWDSRANHVAATHTYVIIGLVANWRDSLLNVADGAVVVHEVALSGKHCMIRMLQGINEYL